jgi:hemin uptake protein HemP
MAPTAKELLKKDSQPNSLARIKLGDFLKDRREIEIDHDGKIYSLRLTRANKLILTT